MPSFKTVFAAAALACVASADTIKITAKSDNTFDPDTVKAKSGDILEFHFEPSNHSVVSGDYRYPCSATDVGKGFFSGYVSSSDGEAKKIFRVTVGSTDPTPFYSSQGDECSKGMVGIINPTDQMNLTDYKERASKLSRAIAPGKNSYGGELVDNSDSGDSSKDDKDGKDGKGDDNKNSATALGVSSLAALGAAVLGIFMM